MTVKVSVAEWHSNLLAYECRPTSFATKLVINDCVFSEQQWRSSRALADSSYRDLELLL